MNETLVTLLTLAVTGALVVIFIMLSKRFNIKKKDMDFSNMLVDLLIYLFNKSEVDFKNREQVELVLKYAQKGLDIALDAYGYIDDTNGMKNYIFDKTVELLRDENVYVDTELLTLLKTVIEFIM